MRNVGRGINRVSPPWNTIVLFVPQASVYIVERFGKFHRVLEPGLAVLMPFVDQVKYVQSFKELAVEIVPQNAITQDNVTIKIDGVLYYRITDAMKASYGIDDPEFAITQLAQTSMRSEIGQLSLDRTLSERTLLNTKITQAMNQAATEWGIEVLRYEIRDVHPPQEVLTAMHRQISAERQKRAEILESEGSRQAAINTAEGVKQALILKSEAEMQTQVNKAEGNATAIRMHADAASEAIEKIAKAIQRNGESGKDAVSLSVAEKYVESFGQIAKASTTVVIPSNMGDVAGMASTLMNVLNASAPSKK
ncbi:hypothetical protein BCR33DRAFT_660077 [Rhizoclosmatium globosum]|uniref:Band 7 domain-containing protein n=1 Tax=Rhizoclosmatium globosum TaxID=329046 RepID=A0A1Y2C9U3_9FUNG|nr:hypothetical protein HDU99_000342 [Rhizoclosmatium hyalinum]KAJ3297405.1 hypothetical protein HDU79_003752 [Rhizoclosmatium sp. JEL0117]ORY43802.1 hypothetical protein BCR33DRAFT_660077 [Rhizoclosmatium globosum]|eukprot:ORY43802.1 hypothetical protein BCR33DRAFT_660077 [Rhizoclosmatium globosum]